MLEKSRAIRDRAIRREQYDLATFVRETERQHFGPELSNLSWREIDHRRNLPPEERCGLIVAGDLGARLFHANAGSKVDSQLQRWLASLGKRLCGYDSADANVNSQELVEIDLGRRWRVGIVCEVHCGSVRHPPRESRSLHRYRADAPQRAPIPVTHKLLAHVSACFMVADHPGSPWHGRCKYPVTDTDSKSDAAWRRS